MLVPDQGGSRITLRTHEPDVSSARNGREGQVAGLELLTDRVRVAVDGYPCASVDVTRAAVADLNLHAGQRAWLTAKATEVTAYPDPGGASLVTRNSPGGWIRRESAPRTLTPRSGRQLLTLRPSPPAARRYSSCSSRPMPPGRSLMSWTTKSAWSRSPAGVERSWGSTPRTMRALSRSSWSMRMLARSDGCSSRM